jgi:hypothetical protein
MKSDDPAATSLAARAGAGEVARLLTTLSLKLYTD